MNKIKLIKLDQTNWLEVTWVKVEKLALPKKDVIDTVLRTKEVETIIHCESFGDSDDYQELLKQRCKELGTEVTEELNSKLKEQVSKRYILTEEEITEQKLNQEAYRIKQIKAKAKELIIVRYTDEQQRNILMSQNTIDIDIMNSYISNIRRISNEAEDNGLNIEDIDWGLNNE